MWLKQKSILVVNVRVNKLSKMVPMDVEVYNITVKLVGLMVSWNLE